MPTWPTSLPQSLNIDGYVEGQESNVVRTSMDVGPDFVRRRYTALKRMAAGSMILTDAQYTTLLTFFNTTLRGGSLAFDWHPQGKHNASPQVIYSMRFLSTPSRRVVERHFQVDMSFEILP